MHPSLSKKCEELKINTSLQLRLQIMPYIERGIGMVIHLFDASASRCANDGPPLLLPIAILEAHASYASAFPQETPQTGA